MFYCLISSRCWHKLLYSLLNVQCNIITKVYYLEKCVDETSIKVLSCCIFVWHAGLCDERRMYFICNTSDWYLNVMIFVRPIFLFLWDTSQVSCLLLSQKTTMHLVHPCSRKSALEFFYFISCMQYSKHGRHIWEYFMRSWQLIFLSL